MQQSPSSGSRAERPGLAKAQEALREGDTLVVWKLDRLGRSVKPLLSGTKVTIIIKRASFFESGCPTCFAEPSSELYSPRSSFDLWPYNFRVI